MKPHSYCVTDTKNSAESPSQGFLRVLCRLGWSDLAEEKQEKEQKKPETGYFRDALVFPLERKLPHKWGNSYEDEAGDNRPLTHSEGFVTLVSELGELAPKCNLAWFRPTNFAPEIATYLSARAAPCFKSAKHVALALCELVYTILVLFPLPRIWKCTASSIFRSFDANQTTLPKYR